MRPGDLLPRLLIAPADLEAIARLAARAYPQECCGLLVGRRDGGWRIRRLVETANRAADPRRTFEVDPATHIALLRALRAAREEQPEGILGNFHSHPDAPAVPSARDLAAARDAGQQDAVWLIASASAEGTTEIAAWLFLATGEGGGAFQPMSIDTVAPPVTEKATGAEKNP
jgi:proteasome lid subunit RPN8/RPN11